MLVCEQMPNKSYEELQKIVKCKFEAAEVYTKEIKKRCKND